MSETIVVVTGALIARPEGLSALLEASLEHVRRSRTEPGCLSHAVSIDAEDSLRLTFLERWADLPSLALHLQQAGSMSFLAAVRSFAATSEGMEVYIAQPANVSGGKAGTIVKAT